jgi:hypothetical protein
VLARNEIFILFVGKLKNRIKRKGISCIKGRGGRAKERNQGC